MSARSSTAARSATAWQGGRLSAALTDCHACVHSGVYMKQDKRGSSRCDGVEGLAHTSCCDLLPLVSAVVLLLLLLLLQVLN